MKQTKGLRRVFSSSSSFAFTSNQKQQQPLADQINNPPPSSSSSPYALLKSMKSEPDAKWALKLFYRASMLPGYRPILPVYDKLISKLARSGHVSSIESLLHHMKSEACNLSEGFCINLINIYGESRLPHKAMTFFSSEMEALGCKRFDWRSNANNGGNGSERLCS
ncbi:pentatricopeptide repeat-containing protein At3g53700, chloroplastic-like [Amborella trichopoda]|uniref:pentatricopeptide repeat-containing protein At3g53700, chloroplastic-like n=1 Tax=Amborella trichopoda TaxID=13333 RepID=UPI0009C06D03|nr:pentatricopeptide repeat-containing protein At3g53700, chloroplastic-like [Amborella trichopoda]|eukprot:XP_011622187.2 pentatricopeptide repeat-containing protein At3g53700, chloroplastic-like [Amborella trichopoda]